MGTTGTLQPPPLHHLYVQLLRSPGASSPTQHPVFSLTQTPSPWRKRSQLWSLTMAPVCVRPVSPVTTPRELCSLPLSADRASVVSSPCDTPSSTVSSPTGTTWRRFGTTPSTTSSVSHQRGTRSC